MSATKQIGVIGGSGVYNIEGIKIVKEHVVNTPFGQPSDKIIEAELGGQVFYFIPRHGRSHSILPHEVNYRANIYALKTFGVDYIISVSAVGSLKEEYAPTHFVLPDQFIDWTKGGRERTFFGNGIVGHVSTATPIDPKLQEVLTSACSEANVEFSQGGAYICIEGPQFSSQAESHLYRSFGASVIGMTNVPESYLAKEAGIAYATIAMVTDYDCWKEEHANVEDIMKVMATNNVNVQKVLNIAIPALGKSKHDFVKENQTAIMTPMEAMTTEQQEIVETLRR